MNLLLLFFALPIATIILAVAVEKILRCPILTAAVFFAIYLIVTFAIFNASFLVFAISYTILAFIAALIAEFFFRRCQENKERRCCIRWCPCRQDNNDTITLSNQDVARIANELERRQNNTGNNCGCNNNDVATINVTNNTTGGRTSWCCYRR